MKDNNLTEANQRTARERDKEPSVNIVVIQNIAELKQKEESLRQREYQQKAILNNIPDIAWLKDSQSRYIAVNEAFGRHADLRLGHSQEDDFDIWPEDLAKRYRDDDMEVMATGLRKQVVEPLIDKEGGSIWMETIKTPVCDEDGKIIGTTGDSAGHYRTQEGGG